MSDTLHVTPATLETAKLETYAAPSQGWTCFHCGETFAGDTMEAQNHARDHFGATPDREPGCLMKIEPGEERALLQRVRRLERANDLLRQEADDEFCEHYYDRVASDIRHIGPAFRECRTFRDIFNVYDSIEGRALAAEERATAAEKEASSWKGVAHDHSERLKVIAADRDALRALINTPVIDDFLKALPLEAAHQQEKHGSQHDAGKTPEDWHWLLAYLANKACRYFSSAKLLEQLLDRAAPDLVHTDLAVHLRAQIQHNREKGVHHIITTAAACLNWHRHVTRDATAMRPGIEPPAESAE